MKKKVLLLSMFFLISVCYSVQSVYSQETSVSEKEKEQKLQQAIELQKKAMAKQKEADVTAKEADAKAKEAVVSVQDIAKESQRNNDGQVFFRSRRGTGGAMEGLDEPFTLSSGLSLNGFYGRGGDQERTTWDFSKQVKESTFSRDYSFDVEASSNTVVMTVMGDCKSGSIRVKILMPNGKVYSDIVIDEFGNLNWRKSFTINEDENKDKAGEWKFKIEADKATGFFKISLQTY